MVLGSLEMAVFTGSVSRLRALVAGMTPAQLRARAYPSDWTVADVLSHLGSGAVIATGWVEQALGGDEVEPQPIWEEWDAKDADRKAADCMLADAALVARLEALTEADRDRFALSLGPLQLDFPGFVRIRLNEHTLHTWDIAVVIDPASALAPDAVPLVLEAVPMLARWAGRSTGLTRALHVHTHDPERRYTVGPSANGVALEPDSTNASPDLVLPAEALIRLVYGRLDPAHTPRHEGSEADLDELRRAFPGM